MLVLTSQCMLRYIYIQIQIQIYIVYFQKLFQRKIILETFNQVQSFLYEATQGGQEETYPQVSIILWAPYLHAFSDLLSMLDICLWDNSSINVSSLKININLVFSMIFSVNFTINFLLKKLIDNIQAIKFYKLKKQIHTRGFRTHVLNE